MAVLALWLGLTVAVHARRALAANAFAALCSLLLVWSGAILAQRLTAQADVAAALVPVENAAGSLVPAVALHVAAAFSAEGRWPRSRTIVVLLAYGVSVVMAVVALAAPDQSWSLAPPHFSLGAIPGEVFGWAWVLARLAMLGLAVAWIGLPLREAGTDRARRQQLLAALATVVIGSIGGALRIVSQAAPTDPWIGVLLISASLMLAAYAVFGQGVFLAPVVAADAFLYSVVIGFGLTAFVATTIALDLMVRQALAIDLPLVLGLALVAAIALFNPIADRVRALIGRVDYAGMSQRLERALTGDGLVAQAPGLGVEPALARVARTFHVRRAIVVDESDAIVAVVGGDPRLEPGALSLPMRPSTPDDPSTAANAPISIGTVIFGHKRSRLPFTAQEMAILARGAEFLADLVTLGTDQGHQADTLAGLSVRRAGVARRGRLLSQALSAASQATPPRGLRVYALGPLRVERAGQLMTRWGGEKAGSRQAEALFAFLFDRGERGVAKDEILELVWPDVDLERADLAFHRTIGGLRTTLEPDRRARNRGEAIVFHHDRYHLDPTLVIGSDVVDLATELAAAGAEAQPIDRLAHLERARALFRGEYLDDCPFYGDSADVEERRDLLRGQQVDLLLALGALYEERGDRPSAALCYRQAQVVAGDAIPRADEALSRLSTA